MQRREGSVQEVLDGEALYAVVRASAEELATLIEPGRVALAIDDVPYHDEVDEEWDRQWSSDEDYLAWLGARLAENDRLLAAHGRSYTFCSPRMAWAVEGAVRARFSVINHITWAKPEQPKAEQRVPRLRRYVEMSERVIFADRGPASAVAYLLAECSAAGITPADLAELLGFAPTRGKIGRAWRYFVLDGHAPIGREHYAEMQQKTGRFQRPYDELYRPFLARVERPFTDVWTYEGVRRRDRHRCEKPAEMATDILATSSRAGEVVLDRFCGSGVFPAVAAMMGRRVIAGDLDASWVDFTRRRIQSALASGQSTPRVGRAPSVEQAALPGVLID